MLQQTADLDLVLAAGDPLRKALAKTPLRGAHLRLVDAAGKAVTDQAFDVPLAAIDRRQLHAGAATFLVSTDHSIGTGAYTGLETRLMNVDHGQWAPEALPVLASSLKNAWRIVDDPASAGGKVIQTVACHPNWANPAWAAHQEFVVELTTYRFAAGWHATSRSAVGFWESDQDWPEDFP